MKEITIIDYGVGNLFSVARACEEVGAKTNFAKTAAEITKAGRLILPGVGAFGDCINEIRKRDLSDAIKNHVKMGKPLLGICVGMQVLLSKGFEFGEHEGLGIIPGNVVRISDKGVAGDRHKVPYVGWARLKSVSERPLTRNADDQWFYFVHSYMSVPENDACVAAYYDYNGNKNTAIIARDNVIGCQFHPEKSSVAGLNLIKGFLDE